MELTPGVAIVLPFKSAGLVMVELGSTTIPLPTILTEASTLMGIPLLIPCMAGVIPT